MRYSLEIKSHGRSLARRDCELTDEKAARGEALRFAADAWGDGTLGNWDGRELAVDVDGAGGGPRFAVHILLVTKERSPPGEDDQLDLGEGHPS
jgi:hypothetical protein